MELSLASTGGFWDSFIRALLASSSCSSQAHLKLPSKLLGLPLERDVMNEEPLGCCCPPVGWVAAVEAVAAQSCCQSCFCSKLMSKLLQCIYSFASEERQKLFVLLFCVNSEVGRHAVSMNQDTLRLLLLPLERENECWALCCEHCIKVGLLFCVNGKRKSYNCPNHLPNRQFILRQREMK